MGATETKKLIFVVESVGHEATVKKIAELKLVLKELTKQMSDANKAGDKITFDNLAVAQHKVKDEIAATTKELGEQKRAFEAAKYPTDSLKGLEFSLAKVTDKLKSLSQEELKSEGAIKLLQSTKQISDEINKQSIALGIHTKNIGRYGESIKQAFTSAFSVLTLAGAAGAVIQLGKEVAGSIVNIEKLYFQIRNITSATDADIELFKNRIPEISNEIGKSQEELLKGLYQITSAQINGKQAIDLLNDSAKLSAIGFGDVNVIAKTLAGTINAYGRENLDASRAAETLFKIVKLGSGDVNEFSESFSTITTVAAHLKIPLEQIGSAVAAITNKGTPAAEAITQVGAVLLNLIKPSKGGSVALDGLNLSYSKLTQLAKIDLLRTLQLITDKFKGNEEAITAVFGKRESIRGVFSLTEDSAKQATTTLAEFNKQFAEIDTTIDKFKETKASKIERFFTNLKNAGIELVEVGLSVGDFFERLYSGFGLFDKKLPTIDVKQKVNINRDFAFGVGSKVPDFSDPFKDKANELLKDPNPETAEERKARLAKEAREYKAFLSGKINELKSNTDAQDDFELSADQRHNKRISEFYKDQEELLKKSHLSLKKLNENYAAFELTEQKRHQSELQDESNVTFFDKQNKMQAELDKKRLADLKAFQSVVDQLDKEDEIAKEGFAKLVGKVVRGRRKLLEGIQEGNKKEKGVSLIDQLFGLDDPNNTEEEKQKLMAFKNASIDTFNVIGDAALAALDREKIAIQENRDIRLKALDDEYSKRKAFAAGNAELLTRIEKERAEKENAINRDAAKKSQAIAIKQALINSALAATNLLATTTVPFPLSLLLLIPLAASLAVQIAAIKSQKFAKGGFAGGFTGLGGQVDETGERVAGIGVYHGGEYIAPKWQVNENQELFHDLNDQLETRGSKNKIEPKLSDPNTTATLPRWKIIQNAALIKQPKPPDTEFTPASWYWRRQNDPMANFRPFAEGGFTTPVISQSIRNSVLGNAGNNTIQTSAELSQESINKLGSMIYTAVSTSLEDVIPKAMEKAMDKVHRRSERDEKLKKDLAA